MDINNVCVVCGKNYVPEGKHICPACEKSQGINNYDYNKVAKTLKKKEGNR